MIEDKLLQRFMSRGIVLGRILYLKAPLMRELISQADESGLAVVGIEGFELHGDMLQPRLDLIADFSGAKDTWHEHRIFCNRNAAGWMSKFSDLSDLLFDASIISEEKWKQLRTLQKKLENREGIPGT